jgi:hypothetical protein
MNIELYLFRILCGIQRKDVLKYWVSLYISCALFISPYGFSICQLYCDVSIIKPINGLKKEILGDVKNIAWL